MKLLNVYDARNNERLLGQHPRWAGDYPNQSFALYPGPVTCNFDPGASINLDYVRLERVTFQKDPWNPEVALITSAPLKLLVQLPGFVPIGRFTSYVDGYPGMVVYAGQHRDYYGAEAVMMHRREMSLRKHGMSPY